MAKGAIASNSAQPSFDDIIQAGRKKKQAETLATRLLGSGRRASAPTVLTGRKGTGNAPGAGSLASRAGISKNSAANSPRFPTSFKTPVPTQPRGPKAATLNRSASNPQLSRKAQALGSVLSGPKGNSSSLRNQVNIVDAPSKGVKGRGGRNEDSEINIRGKSSGPFTVRAQNFAPGTTAADIETVLVPERDVGALVSCNLLASNPTVIAELVFTQKHVAESVIAKYNNKKADGRLLYVYMHEFVSQNQSVQQNQKVPEYSRSTRAPLGTYEQQQPQASTGSDDYMELEVPSEPAATNQRSYNSSTPSQAQPDFQDGTQGFSETRNDNDRRRFNNNSSNGSSSRNNGNSYDSYKPQERYRDSDRDGDQQMSGLQSDRMMGQQRNGNYNNRSGQGQWQSRGGRRGY